MDLVDISNDLLRMDDKESGGDNALDGFEFQISAAIYLMFEQFQADKDFSLLYEKLEDFIIVNDKINLYQAKGVSFSITPTQLIKNRSKYKDNESILEKMYDNYLQVKNMIHNIAVETNLIICDTQFFSSRLWDSKDNYDKSVKEICFDELGESKKKDMLANTRHSNYEWADIKARRLIPKPYHEQVTRCFIENVITEKFGANKINSDALYESLTREIRKIRKNKKFLTSTYLSENFGNFIQLNSKVEYRDVQMFLPQIDQGNFVIKSYFDSFKITYTIPNHPTKTDYERLIDLKREKNFANFTEFLDEVETNPRFNELCSRLDQIERKALLLLVIGTE